MAAEINNIVDMYIVGMSSRKLNEQAVLVTVDSRPPVPLRLLRDYDGYDETKCRSAIASQLE